jgi:hypothetical protein
VIRDGATYPVRHIDQHAEYGDKMHQRRLEATLTDVTGTRTELRLDVFGLIELPTHHRLQTVIREGACRAVIDGEDGAGQFAKPIGKAAIWTTSRLGTADVDLV